MSDEKPKEKATLCPGCGRPILKDSGMRHSEHTPPKFVSPSPGPDEAENEPLH